MNRLILLLQKFSPRELRRLEEMLNTPFFNRDERLLVLFENINRSVLIEGNELDREVLTKVIFPEKKKVTSSFSVLMSRLFGLAQEALVQEQLRLRPETRSYLLLRGLAEKGDLAEVERNGRATLRRIQSQQRMSREDHLNNYLITNLLYELKSTTERNRNLSPDTVAEALDLYYLSHRLPLSYEVINVNQMMNSMEEDSLTSEPVFQIARQGENLNQPLIRLYCLAIQLNLEMDNSSLIRQYLKELNQSLTIIPREELHRLYLIACNFCIQKVMTGDQSFYITMFSIYKRMVEENAHSIGRYIQPGLFKNIISLAGQLGEMKWAFDFLEKYKKYIDPNHRGNLYNYCKAILSFYGGLFDKAIGELAGIVSNDVFFDIGSRFLLLKIYYELGNSTALLNALKPFISFIRNNKSISKNVKKSYTNFANLLGLIHKSRFLKKGNTKSLMKRLDSYKYISGKRWLKEKINNL